MGSLSGRGTEVCEELRKRRVDVCCLQEVRWRGQGARFLGAKGRRYKLWWSGNSEGVGGVGILVKEELCEKVVEVLRKSDRVMTVVMAFEEEVVRILCAYDPQSGRTSAEKERFMMRWRAMWDKKNAGELVLGLGDFNGMLANGLRFMMVCMEDVELGREIWKEGCCWSFVMRRNCVWQTHGSKKEKRGKLHTVQGGMRQRLILC